MDDLDCIIHERGVLASLMLDMEEHGYFFSRLSVLDFSDADNQLLFNSLRLMKLDNIKLDLRLIKSRLDLDCLDHTWTLEGLWDLIKTADIKNGGHDHLRKVVANSVKRQLEMIKQKL